MAARCQGAAHRWRICWRWWGSPASVRSSRTSCPAACSKRAALARALALDPAVLLMDEPFAALDEITRDRMAFELLRVWQQYRKTVLFVTHSLSEAVLLSDRVVLMSPRPGRIHRVYEIDLPRPRTPETRLTEGFAKLVLELNRELYEVMT